MAKPAGGNCHPLVAVGWMRLRSGWQLLGCPGRGFEISAQGLEIFGEHAVKADTVADLRVAGDNRGQDEQSVVELQFDFEARTGRKREDGFDIASAEVEIGGVAADRRGALFGVNFEGDFEFEAGRSGGRGRVGACGGDFRREYSKSRGCRSSAGADSSFARFARCFGMTRAERNWVKGDQGTGTAETPVPAGDGRRDGRSPSTSLRSGFRLRSAFALLRSG